MRHAFNDKASKDHDLDRSGDRFDRRTHKFANSAYRSAKQRGFATGRDVIDSLETDQDFINSLNMPSYLDVVKQGGG